MAIMLQIIGIANSLADRYRGQNHKFVKIKQSIEELLVIFFEDFTESELRTMLIVKTCDGTSF